MSGSGCRPLKDGTRTTGKQRLGAKMAEHSQVVDLLPTRSSDSFGEWLTQHPEGDHGQPRSPRSLRRGRPSRRTRSGPSSRSLSLGSKPYPKRWNANLPSIGDSFESPPRAYQHLPPSPTTEEVKSQTKQIRVRSRIVMQQMEVARQRRRQKTGAVSDD
jgi:hypothetical protein